MKHLLTPFLFLIGLTGLAQPTYLDLFIQFDQYPGETSWTLTQDTIPLITSPDYGFQEYVGGTTEQTLFLEAGVEYTFTITDDFGDGICCGFGAGYFTLGNDCQGLIIENLEFGDSIAEYTFTLTPCIFTPPTANVTFRVDLANAPPIIEVPGVLGNWNGWQVIPMENVGGTVWEVEYEIPLGNYLWKFADFNNPDIQELPIGANDLPCFQFDQFGFINRTLNITEEDEIVLPPYCWESCLPCGGIPGCTDLNALNWNPWANFDDGSCVAGTVECAPGETFIEIVVTPDNFGAETSWILYGDFGAVESAPAGTYTGAAPGIPLTTTVCVPVDQLYDIVIQDSYGDGLCGPCATNNPNLVNGNIVILDCNGNELYNLQDEYPDGNYGYMGGSPQFAPATCETAILVEGCTDSDYVEYNPEATNNDGSCLTPVVLGCLDETQFNYNPEANTEDEITACDFTLTITDGVGDGWFGSWLGIWQFGYNSPQYQMGPNDGTEVSFNIELSTVDPAYVYFFVTPQSIASAQQCGFTLTNPDGEVIIDVPFFSAIPFINESGWYRYEINPYCGNTCIPFMEGCQDPSAINYNEFANWDDESCYYAPGCTSAGYLEYYTQGFEADFDNGSCQTLAVFGCTDIDAFNFDEGANVDNDGCIPKIFGCTNELAFNYDPNANTPDGSCVAVEEGCTDPTAVNYEEGANTDDGSCIAVVLGCIDPNALNFDPLANTDNGACIDVIEGCTDPLALNYDASANVENGSCEDAIFGCTDPTAFNYNELANVDNESCVPVIEGCMDPLALNFDPLANVNNFECDLPIYGCTDTTAFNYNELATTDNGTCIPVIEGCMNPEALNFNADANVDDLSCVLPIYGCTDETALNYDENANTDNGTCVEVIEGCTNPEALNYNPDANVEDFSCIEAIYGCTDSTAFNYNELATVDNGSCIEVIEGCTDPTAFNYNPEANTEDFSCDPFIYGCTDPQAANYDEEANTDNGTCETVYANCIDPVVETYNLLDLESSCFAWVIDVSPSCCNSEWADGCQTLYNYCDENTVTNVEEFGETQITVFPNPTSNIITIASSLNVNATLYNAVGQPIYQNNNVQQIDLSKYEAGIYNLILTYNDLKFTKKIIKQ